MGSDSDYDPSSESDMEDPDSVEVPGGGKSLKDVVQTPTEKGVSIGQTSNPLPFSKLDSKTTKIVSDIVTLPTVDIKPVSISGGELKVNAATVPEASSSSRASTLPARYASMTDYELAGLPIGSDNPMTAADFFQFALPKRFFIRLMEQIVSHEISVAEVNSVMHTCYNPTLLQLLFSIVLNQEEEADTAENNGSGLSSRPKMTPAEVFRYFSSLVSDLRAKALNSTYANSLLQPQPSSTMMMMNKVPVPQTQRYRPSVETLWGSAPLKQLNMEHEAEEDEEQEQEEMTAAETYSDYKPAKLEYGKKHPDPIVETASLASVLPPSCYYKLSLGDDIIKDGLLSALQLESVVYASQQHEHFLESGERAGFLIGDGAGVGKGRTIAGIIYENYLCKRKKSLWVSVSNDLVYDSERDLQDIGAGVIRVNQLSKLKYGKIEGFNQGVLFVTYSGLIGEANKGKNNTRLKQIMQWCGPNFDGVIVFDECHRAKNLCPIQGKSTKTGEAVRDLQASLPKARVIYASATGASEPRHMAYMTRLGLWGKSTPFPTVQDFVKSVEQRGVGAMELVAMDMKLRGAYIARQLSFQGVKFTVVDVPLPAGFEVMYDESVQFWVNAMNKFIEAMIFMKCTKKDKRSIWTNFWGAHQRFFKYLCIASKVKYTVEKARNAVKDGKCVVIGLQATGEARTMDQLERDEGELTEFVSTAKGVLQHLVEKSFPAPGNNSDANSKTASGTSTMFQSLLDEMKDQQPGPSTRNKKPVRKAAQKQSWKKIKGSSDESSSDEHSEFEVSEEGSDSESEALSEYTSSNHDDSSCSDDNSPEKGDCAVFGGWEDSGRKKKGAAAKRKKQQLQRPAKTFRDIEPVGSVTKEAKAMAAKLRDNLLKQIETLGEKLPPNTLDQLIDELGGPTEVAEMTGRKGRVIQDDQGSVTYESRSEIDVSLETINLKEKERFMKGEKLIAIISEAASSGISLQSDRRVPNQRKRVHITLELPWSADRAIQQFGRTHRSNQIHPPEYLFLISNMSGEHRFASIVAKRLESLGALTHGDRRATDSRDLSKYNIDNKFGRLALGTVMRSIMQQEPAIVRPPTEYSNVKNFYGEVANALVGVGLVINSPTYPGQTVLDKDALNMTKFLNRILGMRIKTQNALFQYFTDTLAEVVKRAKRTGHFDLGIVDLADGEMRDVTKLEAHSYQRRHATGTGTIELHKINVNRGMSWAEAERRLNDGERSKQEGFYLATKDMDGRKQCFLALKDPSSVTTSPTKKANNLYMIFRPHIGLQPKREYLSSFAGKYEKVELEEAKIAWNKQYEASDKNCSHMFWGRSCKNRIMGNECEIGVRKRVVHILSGSLLLVWSDVEQILVDSSNSSDVKMQVIRVRGADFRIIGLLIPNKCIPKLKLALSDESYLPHDATFLGNTEEVSLTF